MSGPVRSLPGLALALARAWWRELAALAASAAVLATTIGGGLGVGDAIDRGLRRLAAARLGRIEAAVMADRMVRRTFADDVAEAGAGPGLGVPACVLPVTLATRAGGAVPATLLATDDPAALGFTPAPPALSPGAMFVNARLAADAGLAAGDAVVVRLPKRSAVPADIPLGRRDTDTLGRRMPVAAVIPDDGLGGFSLRPAQVTGPLVVMSLQNAQTILRQGDVVNVVFLVGRTAAGGAGDGRGEILPRPTLADLGISLATVAEPEALRLTSDRLVIPPEIDRVAEEVLRPLGGRPSLAFLATDIVPLDEDGRATAARVPYSTVLGIEAASLPGGDLVDASGTVLAMPRDDEIVINRWLADDLAAQGRPVAIGDRLELRFFLPETIHGRVEEASATFRLVGVAAMQGAAIDRSLVPEVEGVTDEASIADWDPPFPFDAARVRTVAPHDEDDRYWKDHRATPKAFVSLEAARRIAAGRFGRTTAWHLPSPAATETPALATAIAARIDLARAGIRMVPLVAEAAVAARGATPFGPLFLALSSFVTAAALLLAWLLFGLLVAARRREVGVMAALGWPPRRLALLLVAVGGVAAFAGTVAGLLFGPLWARGLLAAVAASWDARVAGGSAAVFTAARPSWQAAVPAAAATLVLSVAAVAAAARRTAAESPRALLAGAAPVGPRGASRRGRMPSLAGGVALVAAACGAFVGRRVDAALAVGLFFGCGIAALTGMLALIRGWLVALRPAPVRSLAMLAARSAAERPGRVFSIAATVACGQFLVAAVSAFAVRQPFDPLDRASPIGGWTTIATFAEPTAIDPSDPEARVGLGLAAAEEGALAGCTIVRLRASGGDDASCTNLYAAARPLVVGVGRDFIQRGGFRFVAQAASGGSASAEANPWRLLERRAAADEPVPVVLDQATAQWALKLGGVGSRFILADEAGGDVACVIVGLLEPGILQGRVVMAEEEFQRLFPSQSGYREALVDASRVDDTARAAVDSGLRRAWADAGVTLESAADRLRRLLAVQETFLAGFQTLGTLGLLLGTAGVAAVMLQGVAERLGMLAVLRAIGFTLTRLRLLVVLEAVWPVVLGLAAGTAAAVLAVWPAIVDGGAAVPVRWIVATCGLTLAVAAAAGWVAASRAAIPERPG